MPPAERSALATAEMRYRGQHHEVAVSFAPAELSGEGLPRIEEAFHRRHEQLYGFDSRERPVEVVALRVTARGRRSELALQRQAGEAPEAPPARAARPAYLPSRAELAEVAVFDADRLATGCRARRSSRAPTPPSSSPRASTSRSTPPPASSSPAELFLMTA